jgi:hypothetical protein
MHRKENLKWERPFLRSLSSRKPLSSYVGTALGHASTAMAWSRRNDLGILVGANLALGLAWVLAVPTLLTLAQ